MKAMPYDVTEISMTALVRPAFDAGIALTRLDERIARSTVGSGFLERQNFGDAYASLWIDGELVHLEDLVLHDAFRDTRSPTHELTIARDVLRTRRRISGQLPDWALSPESILILRQTSEIASLGIDEASLTLAKTMMNQKLQGRRTSSKLPELVELVMARPLVSAGMVAKTLDVTPQAARRIVLELGLHEMKGRGFGRGGCYRTLMLTPKNACT